MKSMAENPVKTLSFIAVAALALVGAALFSSNAFRDGALTGFMAFKNAPAPANEGVPGDAFLADKFYCEKDSDCVCGGTNPEDNSCFVGNKYYHDAVVLGEGGDGECGEFCAGLSQGFKLRCVKNSCTAVQGEKVVPLDGEFYCEPPPLQEQL